MNPIARLYQCALCHIQTIICAWCDRGNIYCSEGCSTSARSASCRASNRRYQNTFKGRQKHAARQSSYRIRQKKVTDQGSPSPLTNDLLPKATDERIKLPSHCHFCGRACDVFVRCRFLRQRTRPTRILAYRSP